MQIAQLSTSSKKVAASDSGTARVLDGAAVSSTGSKATASGNSGTGSSSNLKSGLSNWDTQLQGEISSAQQTLDYLDGSTRQLQALKSELAAKLAARQGREGQVEARVRQFSNTWSQRSSASGGSLDAQLNYSATTSATQSFTIRGLNMANLQTGPQEMLAFSVGGSGATLASVTVEPGMTDDEVIARFNQALTALQVGVRMGENGALVFSAPESSWPTVRDTLAVRGNGIRFPTGEMNRVKTDQEPAAIAPESWSTDDIAALRATLQRVMQALAQLQQARSSVSLALAQASGRVNQAQSTQSSVSMDILADSFTEKASQPGYESLLAISSALVGISRERVVSLLGLR